MEREFPDDENGDVLRRMLLNGDDLSSPRDIDFSIIFPHENSAMLFAERIIPDFDKVSHSEMETTQSLKWEVTVTRHMLPTHGGITEIEEFLAGAATPLGGKNDGWGCFNIIS
jgi:hypothetical protein